MFLRDAPHPALLHQERPGVPRQGGLPSLAAVTEPVHGYSLWRRLLCRGNPQGRAPTTFSRPTGRGPEVCGQTFAYGDICDDAFAGAVLDARTVVRFDVDALRPAQRQSP